MTIHSGLYGRLLEPGLRKVFFNSYREVPEQYTQLFNIEDSEKPIETDFRMGGLGPWEKKDSMGQIKYQDPIGSQVLQYIHEEYASGFTVERKLVDDLNYNTINKMAKDLGRGARLTVEKTAFQVLNQAFDVAGFDGVPLISASHKRLDGGGMNNLLSSTYGGVDNGALSDRNLKAALIQMRKQVDDNGNLIQAVGKVLVVPAELEFVARTILNSDALSVEGKGTGITNDANTLKNKVRLVVVDHLDVPGAPNAWFVLDPTVAQLNFFWRKRLEFKNTEDFDTMQAKYRGYMRFSVGYSDYRGIVGSKGTGAA